MLPKLIFISIILLMLPVIYVLFFTQTLDRIVLRLRLGKRADSLKTTADVLDRSIDTTVHDLAREKNAVEQALKTASDLKRPSHPTRTYSSKPPADPEPAKPLVEALAPYVVCSVDDNTLFWSAKEGWVSDLMFADRFDTAAKLTVPLPPNGRWYRPRKSQARS